MIAQNAKKTTLEFTARYTSEIVVHTAHTAQMELITPTVTISVTLVSMVHGGTPTFTLVNAWRASLITQASVSLMLQLTTTPAQ